MVHGDDIEIVRFSICQRHEGSNPFNGRSASPPILGEGARRREGAALRVEFDLGGSELVLKDGAWNDLELAWADGVYHPAKAVFKGNSAMVSSPAIREPRGLRYGWKAVFTPSLFNAAGLPSAPFAVSLDSEGELQPGLVADITH